MREVTGSAPGRLDVLGGVADYSGSLVLETPTAATTMVTIREESIEHGLTFEWPDGQMLLPSSILSDVTPGDLDAFAERLDDYNVPKPVRYLAGCLFAAGTPPRAYRLSVTSSVPESMGVSSSAALEVATLRALRKLGMWERNDLHLARMAQAVENRVVRAPCGIMDQIASVFGQAGALLPIRCQPDEVLPSIPLPDGLMVVGWPSGVKHDVGGSPYLVARTAAFMGKQWIESKMGQQWEYTAQIPIDIMRSAGLPTLLKGADYLRDFGEVKDPLSRIDPDQVYPVEAAVRFPIEENKRAARAMEILGGNGSYGGLGELLYASHAGYGQIGLGADETDRMVEAVRASGPENGLIGARISGGGCGGTVVVILEKRALSLLEQLDQRVGAGLGLIV